MKKKELFFVCIFMVCFLSCATFLAGDYLSRYVESEEQSQPPYSETFPVADAEADKEDAPETEPEKEEEKETWPEIEPESEPESGQESETEGEQEMKQEPDHEPVGREYFEDALFIGDSRTVGLMEYGNMDGATFFADSGMSVFKLDKKKVYLPSEGKLGFEEVLTRKEYGKVYLMLGINELGYRFDILQEKYKETVERIQKRQGNAIIYLCANMHVTEEQSQKDEIYNNQNINRVNKMISSLADNERIFYIDVNEKFDDENGSLSTEYASDSFHVYGKYYMDWVDWLCTSAVSQY